VRGLEEETEAEAIGEAPRQIRRARFIRYRDFSTSVCRRCAILNRPHIQSLLERAQRGASGKTGTGERASLPHPAAGKRRGSDEAHGGQTQLPGHAPPATTHTAPTHPRHLVAPLQNFPDIIVASQTRRALWPKCFSEKVGDWAAISLNARFLRAGSPAPRRVAGLAMCKSEQTAFSCGHTGERERSSMEEATRWAVHGQRQPFPQRPGGCMSYVRRSANSQEPLASDQVPLNRARPKKRFVR
jgi:hypothetical protein